MHYCIVVGLFLSLVISAISLRFPDWKSKTTGIHFREISDEDWEDIKGGQWLIGIFHQDSPQSGTLEKDWNIFALKCKEFDLKVGKIKAHENPELQVRFLAKEFPKVFYIDNGIAHVIPTPTRDELVRIIKDKQLEGLEPVAELYNPFSTHLSLFSYLCSRALILYNFERQFLSEYSGSLNLVNAVFGFSFIIFGTAIGLVFSCCFQLLKFAVHCCFQREPCLRCLPEGIEPDYSLRENSASYSRASKANKKNNATKGRMKVRKRKP